MTIFAETACPNCGPSDSEPLVSGRTANTGCVSGPVSLLMDPSEGAGVEPDAILVTPMTDPDCVPAMERAAAIVTDHGGLLCHAAIVSREMGKPCIVGTKTATKALEHSSVVRVCATTGHVFSLASL